MATPGQMPGFLDLTIIATDVAIDWEWKLLAESLGSDHLITIITNNNLGNNNRNRSSFSFKKFNYKTCHWELFKLEIIENCNENIINNVNQFKNFMEMISKALDKSCKSIKKKNTDTIGIP